LTDLGARKAALEKQDEETTPTNKIKKDLNFSKYKNQTLKSGVKYIIKAESATRQLDQIAILQTKKPNLRFRSQSKSKLQREEEAKQLETDN